MSMAGDKVPTGLLVSGRRRLRRWRAAARALRLASVADAEFLKEPVFVVGCGRSGTTVLGRLLAAHDAFAYLNEPRAIWLNDPRTDVWTADAEARGGRLRLTADDVLEPAASQIRTDFAAAVRLRGKRRLAEKLPINSFRIRYVNALFPDARFISIVRDARDVARSIADLDRSVAAREWFGVNDFKWRLLADFARERGDGELVDLCQDYFSRGLLEWRLSVATAREDLRALPESRRLELRYEDLTADPERACSELEKFLGAGRSAGMRVFARSEIERRPHVAAPVDGVLVERLAGELLRALGYVGAAAPTHSATARQM